MDLHGLLQGQLYEEFVFWDVGVFGRFEKKYTYSLYMVVTCFGYCSTLKM
jgi:hypothetical protein